MTDPYEVLGLTADADEAEIRRRYLELVREFTPERAPERFAVIRAAYEEVRDPLKRLESELFSVETQDSISTIAADTRAGLRRMKIPTAVLLKLAD